MSPLLLLLMTWFLDRTEGDTAVLTDGRGGLVEVPAAALTADLLGPTAPLRTSIDRRRAHLLGLERPGQVRHGAPVKRRSDHRQDHFFHKAKKEGFAARSVYKLEEIDQKHRLLRRGQKVLDLGCSPGSWLQYAAKVVGPEGRVVGIDLKPVKVALPPHATAREADAFDISPDELLGPGQLFDVVLSDMAPGTTGNRFSDHMRSMELCHRVLQVGDRVLRPGGSLVCKAFEGEDIPLLAEAFRSRFGEFRRIKPKGTRTESVELFFIGLAFRGAPPASETSVDAEHPLHDEPTGDRG